jgi:hypothetical protein
MTWALTQDQVRAIATRDCFYCGKAPAHVMLRGWSRFVYNGLDRFDNAKGYEPGNVVPCCGDCNVAKNTRDAAEFVSWASRISSHSLNVLLKQHGSRRWPVPQKAVVSHRKLKTAGAVS